MPTSCICCAVHLNKLCLLRLGTLAPASSLLLGSAASFAAHWKTGNDGHEANAMGLCVYGVVMHFIHWLLHQWNVVCGIAGPYGRCGSALMITDHLMNDVSAHP